MREENKDRKRCTPAMPKDPDYNSNYGKSKDGDAKEGKKDLSEKKKAENPVQDMMADANKSSKKVEDKEDHPGDSKPKESGDAKPKDDKDI